MGIGSDSGRLVLALGISVLRAVDAVDTALAFRRLHRDVEIWWQGLGPLPKTSLATILELVRYVQSCDAYVFAFDAICCATGRPPEHEWTYDVYGHC